MNEIRKKYKEETKQPITEKPMGNFDYFKDEYVFWLEEQLEAISVTRCCDKLKTKEIPTFKEWLKHFKNEGNYYLFGKEKLYSEKEMLNIYNNLPNY